MAMSGAHGGNRFIAMLAENSQSAPISALIWWIIPLAALIGGLAYAFWVSRLKSKFDNQTERSVTRFQKFQKSFQERSFQEKSLQNRRDARDDKPEN